MATLHGRAGDVQALKVCAAAHLSGASVSFAAASSINDVVSKGSNPFGTNTVLLVAPSVQLSEPSAAAAFLAGGPSSLTLSALQWLDWDQAVLRPATLLGGEALAGALAQVEAAVAGGQLSGAKPGLAEVAVGCSLVPLALKGQLSGPLAAFASAVAAAPAVAAAAADVGAGLPSGADGAARDATLAAFDADAAAHAAAVPKRPIPGRRNILITSALPYVNNVPHLGNIIGCVLSADCYARYCRARGHNCIYVCGTDEYGTATETKALEEGLTCQQICDKYHAIHADIYRWFDIGFDRFGRTPTRAQTSIAQDIFKTLHSRGQLVEQEMQQLYSEAAGKFLADRFVYGTCPKCKYEDARGDQCDGCGNLLNPTELINPRCKLTGTTPVLRSTRHVFLDLPQLSPALQEYITNTSTQGGWSANCVQLTNAWMRDGLKLRCITRDLRWGTPVPLEGYEDKVFYVWFDAPIGYISITAGYTPDWEAWWKNPKDVEMVQFMGKDNVPFHTVIFPATLLGTGQDWTMMRSISVTEYLNYEGGKFSKSRGTGVFGNQAQDTGIPVEVWRYYLLANRPEQSDTDFKWSDLAAKNNSELMANLGNFVNRGLMFVSKFFDGQVPGATAAGVAEAEELGKAVAPKVEEYLAAMEKIKIREGIRLVMSISADGNKFLQDTKPWVAVKEDKDKCATLVAASVGMVRLLAALMAPYMPSLAAKILAQLNLPYDASVALTDDLIAGAARPHTLVAPGHVIGTPGPLIGIIPDEKVDELRARFGGNQAADEAAAAASGPGGKPGAAAAGAKGGAAKAAAAKGGAAADKGKGAGEKKAPAEEGPLDVSRLDVRVGVIKKAWKHPDAESLYVEEVDVGEEAPRQVVSGLVKYIPAAEQLVGRRVVLLCNLKPAAMRGVQSQAMVLAASNADGSQLELLEPPAGAPVGERVTWPGFSEGRTPDEQLNPRKKIFETVQPDFTTTAECVAVYKGAPFTTTAGPVKVASIVGASIK
ncbi:hypothetical protein HYH03_011947 [Edaphochlamys debaryana]|uniref:methionine--tRNA ligase n=1 Tax=Edaphochlamys debaryana TaxID=47281 RepID=A0A835XTK2_9CHLO|nr:hypothetical protein HYH03_011947 [Edaphochlamys debaryana]|eukprot:KAG2489494.1 hypothetical protein HYH03_011947 [Edaphochlamys debaryana]